MWQGQFRKEIGLFGFTSLALLYCSTSQVFWLQNPFVLLTFLEGFQKAIVYVHCSYSWLSYEKLKLRKL